MNRDSARHLLDRVRAGLDAHLTLIDRALWATGDLQPIYSTPRYLVPSSIGEADPQPNPERVVFPPRIIFTSYKEQP